jgi:hypothetical protein
VHRGQRGQSYEYELLHDQNMGSEGAHLSGLIDVAALQSASVNTATKQSSRGSVGEFAGPMRPQNGPNAGGVRTSGKAASPHGIRATAELPSEDADLRATPTHAAQHVIPARASYPQPLAA